VPLPNRPFVHGASSDTQFLTSLEVSKMEFLRCRAGVVEFAVKLSSSLLVYSSVISVSHPRYWSPPSQIGFDNNSLSVSIWSFIPWTLVHLSFTTTVLCLFWEASVNFCVRWVPVEAWVL